MNPITFPTHAARTSARSGPHHLMLGTIVVSRLLDGAETGGRLALVELRGLPGSGPGPHLDPWTESFYVLEGELTFRVEEDGAVRELVAHAGDAVSIPEGAGHAFTVTSNEPARFLILGSPSGIETFFADAGDEVDVPDLPAEAPPTFDRERLLAAFGKHGLTPYSFPEEAGGDSSA